MAKFLKIKENQVFLTEQNSIQNEFRRIKFEAF